MASLPIVISSDEDGLEDDVVVVREIHTTHPCVSVVKTQLNGLEDKENDVIHILDSPFRPELRINKAKLESLKKSLQRHKGIARKINHASPNNHIRRNELKFTINKARLKKLKAVVKIELDTMYDEQQKSPFLKVEGEGMQLAKELLCIACKSTLQCCYQYCKVVRERTSGLTDVSQDSEIAATEYYVHSPPHSPPHFPPPSPAHPPLLPGFQSLTPPRFHPPVHTNPPSTGGTNNQHDIDAKRNLFQSTTKIKSPPRCPIKSSPHSPNHSQSPAKSHSSVNTPTKKSSEPMSFSPPVANSQSPTSGRAFSVKSPQSQVTIKRWFSPTPKTSVPAPAVSVDVKCVEAKRNEVVWPPSHVTLDRTEFIKKLYKPPRTFSATYNDIIEGLQDEQFYVKVVRTIYSLTSSRLAPPSQLLWYLVNDILLKSGKHKLSCSTYCVLNEIHARFPARCLEMNIRWRDIEKLAEQLTTSSTNDSELQTLNVRLALSFLLTVLSSEVKSTALKTKPTRITKYFSANFDTRNMKEIVVGIKMCLSNHADTCGDGKRESARVSGTIKTVARSSGATEAAAHTSDTTEAVPRISGTSEAVTRTSGTTEAVTRTSGTSEAVLRTTCTTKAVTRTSGTTEAVAHITVASISPSANNGICSLGLFQNLLKLVTMSSSNKDYVANRIADELMYLYMDLTTLEARILLLQSLTSHRVRRYLIEVLLMNYCSLLSDALQGNDVSMGARKILFQDFRRVPPCRSIDHGGNHRSVEEIEEYVTLLAYVLQSYVAMHEPSLQCYHGDFPLFQSEQVKQFTNEDVELFSDLQSHTLNLRKSCESFLEDGQHLSCRTNVLLEIMAMAV